MKKLKETFKDHKRLLILLDYDGTLTDFKKNPEHSHISASTRATLKRLKRKFPVILVTGRYVGSLIKISGLKDFPIIGTHGFEAKNLPRQLRFASRPLEKKYKKEAVQLWNAVRGLPLLFPGIHIERKPFSSTLHFRGVKLSNIQIHQLHEEFTARYQKAVTPQLWSLQKGKKMIEVMPKGFSKGKAVSLLLKHFPNHLAVYAGDDVADISVFKVLGKKGLKIAVGSLIPRQYCDIRFKTPRQFTAWLDKLSRVNAS